MLLDDDVDALGHIVAHPLAVPGLILSTIIVGVMLSSLLDGFNLLSAALFGALISATDPVAVVAIFKEVGAPKRLVTLLEGEGRSGLTGKRKVVLDLSEVTFGEGRGVELLNKLGGEGIKVVDCWELIKELLEGGGKR